MPLTSEQDIPNKPQASEPWTFKRLFSAPAISVISKAFVNPFDIMMGYLVFIAGAAELINKDVSVGFWLLIILTLTAGLIEKHDKLLHSPKPEIKEKTK